MDDFKRELIEAAIGVPAALAFIALLAWLMM
jgi:hypothetical protein